MPSKMFPEEIIHGKGTINALTKICSSLSLIFSKPEINYKGKT